MTQPLWTRIAGVNLVFAAFHPWLGLPWPAVVMSLAINAVLFVVPAAGWGAVAGPASRALGMRVLRALAVSTGVFFAALLIIRMTGRTPTPVLAWNILWVLTNLGFVVSALARRPIAVRRSLAWWETALGGGIFLACYAVYFTAAILTPAQVDHDLEVQGTGYGLVTRFEPLLLTDRGTAYYFAHPPLLHFYVGGSFLLYGALPDLAAFDQASQRARAALASSSGVATARRSEADPVDLQAIYDHFAANPHKLETRTPNVFFASATVALLGLWATRLARRWWLGLLVAVAYASNPEVFVRSSYGGYFAIGGLTAALMLLAAERWKRWPTRRTSVASVMAGWLSAVSDHKLVLLPAALEMCRLAGRVVPSLAVRDERGTPGWRAWWSLHPVSIGFSGGLVAFWAFGLAWAPLTFLRDHFHDHLLDRITHENPLGYSTYPSAVGLWTEFASHTALVVIPLGVLLLLVDTWQAPRRGRRRAGAFRGLWLVWTLVTGVAFTVVDWRMTKHLVPMLLPLHLGLTPASGMPRWRTVLSVAVLGGVVLWNVNALVSLTRNFASFAVTPGW